jgi:hypothetical protein
MHTFRKPKTFATTARSPDSRTVHETAAATAGEDNAREIGLEAAAQAESSSNVERAKRIARRSKSKAAAARSRRGGNEMQVRELNRKIEAGDERAAGQSTDQRPDDVACEIVKRFVPTAFPEFGGRGGERAIHDRLRDDTRLRERAVKQSK